MITLPDLVRERAARVADAAPSYGLHDPVEGTGVPDDLRTVQMTVAEIVRMDLAWAVLDAVAPLLDPEALSAALASAAARLRPTAERPSVSDADGLRIATACQALARDVQAMLPRARG